MNQETLLHTFITNQTVGWLEEDLPTMENEFPANREKMIVSLSAAIKEVCCQARQQQEAGAKGSAAYLCISFLRTNILDDIWQYRLDLYDEKFPLDRTECSGIWNMEFVWGNFTKRLTELADAVRSGIYVNKIRPFNINAIKMTMAEKYNLAAIVLTQMIIKEAIQTPEYADMAKVIDFTIMMGEYQDQCITIYEESWDQDENSSN